MKKTNIAVYLIFNLFIFFIFSGCEKYRSLVPPVGPNYDNPDTEIPETWHRPPDPALIPTPIEIQKWWTLFNDPMLDRFISQAEKSNLDLRVAVARVKEARAQLAVATGEKIPLIDAVGTGTHAKTSGNIGAGEGTTGITYSIGLDASWEIDLFGRISRSIEAATGDYQASEEDRIDVMITMYSEVARAYLSIRTFQARLTASKGNIKSQREVLELTQSKFKHGLAAALDVAQAERVLASSEAEVPPLRSDLAQAINNIGVLLGKPPGTFHDTLRVQKAIPIPPVKVAVGVPADLLRQRPDIRRAERELAAQTARIGLATADLYPSFSLVGTLGLTSISAGDLLTGSSSFYTFGPSLKWNILDGSRIRNRIKVEDARTEQSLLAYEQAVLNALKEAENAMTAVVEQRMEFEAQMRSADAARRALRLSTKLYKDGLLDFQDVLDSQRSLFSIENEVAASKGQAAQNLVNLYKALGGGWNPPASLPETAKKPNPSPKPAKM
jgi:outer membrane protein, multidrug efflux system